MEGECTGRSHSVSCAYHLLLTHHCLLGEMEPSETMEHSVLHYIRYNQMLAATTLLLFYFLVSSF